MIPGNPHIFVNKKINLILCLDCVTSKPSQSQSHTIHHDFRKKHLSKYPFSDYRPKEEAEYIILKNDN